MDSLVETSMNVDVVPDVVVALFAKTLLDHTNAPVDQDSKWDQMDVKMSMNVSIMDVILMQNVKTLQVASDANVRRDSVVMEVFALMSMNVNCQIHVDLKVQDVSIQQAHTDVSVNKDTEVMDSHVFLNLSLPIKLVNFPNLLKPVPLTMEAIALKNSMEHLEHKVLMDNLMVKIDLNMVVTMVMSFMVWAIMTMVLDGMAITFLIQA